MTAALWVDYAGLRFALVTSLDRQTCTLCSKAIRPRTKSYRSTKWGPNNDATAYFHQKCITGQLDPTVWDIP